MQKGLLLSLETMPAACISHQAWAHGFGHDQCTSLQGNGSTSSHHPCDGLLGDARGAQGWAWQTQAGDSHLSPSAPAPGVLWSWTTRRAAKEIPGLGSDLSTQRRRTKDTSAAAQQGLPETFLTKINHSALAGCPWGVAAGRNGSKGRGRGLEPPALLRVGLLPVRWTPLPLRHRQPFPDQMHINYTEQLKPQGFATRPGSSRQSTALCPRTEPGPAPVQPGQHGAGLPLQQHGTEAARKVLVLL